MYVYDFWKHRKRDSSREDKTQNAFVWIWNFILGFLLKSGESQLDTIRRRLKSVPKQKKRRFSGLYVKAAQFKRIAGASTYSERKIGRDKKQRGWK